MPDGFGESSAVSVVGECPLSEEKKKTHWIAVELVGEDDKPIPFERFELTLPGGAKVEGYLNEKGVAQVDGIHETGTCILRFPELDKDAWEEWKAQ